MGEIAVSKLGASDPFALWGLEIHDQPGLAEPQTTPPGEEAS
jgi:hypothetical protein